MPLLAQFGHMLAAPEQLVEQLWSRADPQARMSVWALLDSNEIRLMVASKHVTVMFVFCLVLRLQVGVLRACCLLRPSGSLQRGAHEAGGGHRQHCQQRQRGASP
jgi:hypothetical protein